MNAPAQVSKRPSLCDYFKSMLVTTWTRSAISGKYKDTFKILEWMKTEEFGEKASNADRLLREVFNRSQARVFIPNIDFDTVDRCYLVFSILLEIGHGDLIDYFRELIKTDQTLDSAHFQYKYLEKDLISAKVGNAKDIIDRFDNVRWSYLPPKFKLGFDGRFHDRRQILPFCKREPITEKGGTAQLWQVAIEEDHVQQDLRYPIERSKFKDETFGWVSSCPGL
jgi:hypothetical protein